MCTCMIAGRKATAGGAVLMAANNDWSGVPGVLMHVPRACHGSEDVYTLTGGMRIPQLAETFGYSHTACKYSIGNLNSGWAGGVNDRGLAVAGTGVCAFKAIPWEGCGLELDDVPLLLLQRAPSAREGIRMMGELIQRYGMRPSCLDGSESVATFSVADASEGWVLEIAPGRHWVAVRVPDEELSIRVNAFGTHDADLTDSENVMASPGLADYARQQGWWDGDNRHFDFSAAYGADSSPNEWGPEQAAMNMRRRWRAMSLVAGRDTPEDALLYSVRPANPVTRQDIMRILEDVYEGTPYDLTVAPGAGKWGNPFVEETPDYAICRSCTVGSFVAELSAEKSASVMWTAMATPRMSFYIPLYTDVDSLPAVCEGSEPEDLTAPSLFWEFKKMCMLTERRYSRHIALTATAKQQYEISSAQQVAEEQKQIAVRYSPEEGRAMRTAFTREHVENSLILCRRTQQQLLLQY